MNCNSSACLCHLGIWEIGGQVPTFTKTDAKHRNLTVLSPGTSFKRTYPKFNQIPMGKQTATRTNCTISDFGCIFGPRQTWSYLANREARAGRGGFHPNNLEILVSLLNMGNRWPGPDLYQNRWQTAKSSRFIARHHFLANRPQINQFPIGKQMTNHTKCTISHFGTIFGSCHNLVRSGGPKGASKLKSVIKLW